jgi:saccharopine dehydrogenase (NAD+, L-lysine-forming)
MVEGTWMESGVWNMEQLDPDAFMADMNKYGLSWKVIEEPGFDLI